MSKEKGKIVDWKSDKPESDESPFMINSGGIKYVKYDDATRTAKGLEAKLAVADEQIAALEAQLVQANKGRASLQESLAMTEALLVEVEGRLAQHEWVSVEDRLPEDLVIVLVTNNDAEIKEIWKSKYCHPINAKACWGDVLYKPHPTHITHWKLIHLPSASPTKAVPETGNASFDNLMKRCTIPEPTKAESEQPYPQIICPQCGHEFDDMDGFGFIFCKKCKHCTHPSTHEGHCGICGIVMKENSNG